MPQDSHNFEIRPGWAFVVLYRPAALVLSLLLGFGAASILGVAGRGDLADRVRMGAIVLAVLIVVVNVGEWLSRRYRVEGSRLTIRAGLLRRIGAEVPLRNVQHVTLGRSLGERILGVGTIGIATAGSDGPAVYLLHVARPEERLAALRRAMAGVGWAPLAEPGAPPTSGGARPLVIGLAGGIGSGKSEVARALAERGCLVFDSDREAKLALDRPDVREELVRWWGAEILGADGRVERGKVAEIIFGDAAQRARLEALVHPLVKRTRGAMIAQVDASRIPAVIVDAPLLYEAGLDKECDAVVFVDAPREQRLARVHATRGWDPSELDRREKAQLPLEEKRQRADVLIRNDAGVDALRRAAGEALDRILAAHRRGGAASRN